MTDGGKYTKYMEDDKITPEQFGDAAYRRKIQMGVKSEAVWVTFHELDGIINISKLAKVYFKKSQSWLAQKINGLSVNGKEKEFTPDEYRLLSASLRDIADRLNGYADAIDAAR